MTLVSVIIASYNCEKFIAKAVDSILQQTHSDLEILICDDCSEDNTWNILQRYNDNRIKFFRNEKNSGVVYTRNFLLSQSHGEFIAIQDADDWSERNRIEILLNEFESRKDIDACGSAFHRVWNNGSISNQSKTNSFYVTLNDCLELPFVPASLMIHRRVYEDVGGYHPYFAGLFAEDLYWIVIILSKYKVLYLNVPLYYYRLNPDSITNTFDNLDKLVVIDIMKQLIIQRKTGGTDWVEKNEIQFINEFKAKKFADKKWLSEKYRIAAAVQRNGNKRRLALKMILKAFQLNPYSAKNFVTLRYILFF